MPMPIHNNFIFMCKFYPDADPYIVVIQYVPENNDKS